MMRYLPRIEVDIETINKFLREDLKMKKKVLSAILSVAMVVVLEYK